MVDSVIVVGENVKAPGVAADDSEGLVIELLFNAVSFNMNIESHTFADKKVNTLYCVMNFAHLIFCVLLH